MDSSHNETNNQLIRPKDRELADTLSTLGKRDRSLPPLKPKPSVNLVDSRINKTLVSYSFTPPSIKR